MRRSGFSARRAAFTLLEAALSITIAGLVVAAFILVDAEVRRAYALLRRELVIESIYRDLAADQDRTVVPALSRAADPQTGLAAPIRPGAGALTLQGAPSPAGDTLVRLVREAAGTRLMSSPNNGASWTGWLGIGDRGTLQNAWFHYGGWIDATDQPLADAPPYTLDPRVRYDVLRLHAHLGSTATVPYYVQAVWAPRSPTWSWARTSRAGLPVPGPELAIFMPIGIWRGALPAEADAPFDLFHLGLGGGGIGWLSWDGDVDTTTLVENLRVPHSNLYVDPDAPTAGAQPLTAGSWIQATPGHHAGAAAALQALQGRDILVAVWDQTRGRGAKTDVQAFGFARVRVDTTGIPDARATFLSWTDDQGADLPRASWPAGVAAAATASPAPPSSTPAATPTPAPTPLPTTAASATPQPLPVLPLALNLPPGTVPGATLGWQREGTDFAWLSWGGSLAPAVLATSLTPPGDAASYVNPEAPGDRTLDPGDPVVALTAGTDDAQVASRADALVGATFVVPTFSEVHGSQLSVSGFVRVQLTRADLSHHRLQVTYLGPK